MGRRRTFIVDCHQSAQVRSRVAWSGGMIYSVPIRNAEAPMTETGRVQSRLVIGLALAALFGFRLLFGLSGQALHGG